MLFLTVDYIEGFENKLVYRGVVLEVGSAEVKRKCTDDFIEDYNVIVAFAKSEFSALPLMCSSSVSHYINDAELDVEWLEEG